jgi:hypothetical protein
MTTDHLTLGAWFTAGLAVVSLASAALTVTLIAGTISIILGLMKLYDRLTRGDWQ